jgi:hypothetical protein
MIFKLVLILQTSFQASIAFVRDTNTCNQTVNVIFTVFTPNEDSINDLWTIKNLDLLTIISLTAMVNY